MSNELDFRCVYELENGKKTYLLTSFEEVTELASLLNSKYDEIAVDQERAPFNKYFYQKPCLVQIGTDKGNYLLDLLSDPKMILPMKEIFNDPKITKVFFSASSDLFYFEKYYDIHFESVYDIQVASDLLYKENTMSLTKLAETELEIIDYDKPKSVQKSDWSQRPLKKKQLQYASLEISYFLPIKRKIEKKIKEKHLAPFVDHANARLLIEIPIMHEFIPETIRRRSEYQNDLQTDHEKALALKLAELRINVAKRKNIPPFKIFDDKVIFQIIKNPKSIGQTLRRYRSLKETDKNDIKNLLSTDNLELSIEYSPPLVVNFADLPLLRQQLVIWRKSFSSKSNIPKRYILTKKEIDGFDYSSIDELKKELWFLEEKNDELFPLQESYESFIQNFEID